jgi:hypothetical protein
VYIFTLLLKKPQHQQRDQQDNQQMKNNNGLLALDEQLKSVLSGEKHENAPNMVSTPPIIEQHMSITTTTTTNPNIQQQQPTQSFNNTGDLPIHLPPQQQQQQQQQQTHQNQQQYQLPNIIDSSVLNFSPSASINRRNSVDVKVIASLI